MANIVITGGDTLLSMSLILGAHNGQDRIVLVGDTLMRIRRPDGREYRDGNPSNKITRINDSLSLTVTGAYRDGRDTLLPIIGELKNVTDWDKAYAYFR